MSKRLSFVTEWYPRRNRLGSLWSKGLTVGRVPRPAPGATPGRSRIQKDPKSATGGSRADEGVRLTFIALGVQADHRYTLENRLWLYNASKPSCAEEWL